MFSKYLDHIDSKTTHERRQHAMQLSGGIIAVVFVVWISTIGLRFASTPAQTADINDNSGQTANVISGAQDDGQARLVVATTSQQ